MFKACAPLRGTLRLLITPLRGAVPLAWHRAAAQRCAITRRIYLPSFIVIGWLVYEILAYF